MLPNFIIAGATRSGTTSLYYYLKQHPQISFPNLKEPRYFSSIHLKLPQQGIGDHTVDEKLITSLEDYKKLYEDIENKIVGDASSEYLTDSEHTPSEIHKLLGDIPILLILRNPVDRAYSAFYNLTRDGRETLTFEEALKEEENRIQKNWDVMWAYKKVGLYADQVKEFLDKFSNVKILIFEEFSQNPEQGLKEIFKFLNIDENVNIDISTKYSHSGKPNNKFIGWLIRRDNPITYPFRTFALKIIPRSYLEKFASGILSKENIDDKTRKELYRFFENDIKKLEKLIDKDLSLWGDNI